MHDHIGCSQEGATCTLIPWCTPTQSGAATARAIYAISRLLCKIMSDNRRRYLSYSEKPCLSLRAAPGYTAGITSKFCVDHTVHGEVASTAWRQGGKCRRLARFGVQKSPKTNTVRPVQTSALFPHSLVRPHIAEDGQQNLPIFSASGRIQAPNHTSSRPARSASYIQ